MHLRYLLCALFLLSQSNLFSQISFTKQTQLLNPENHYSGVAIAVLDMNGDGRDDIVRMDQGFRLAVEYQTAPGKPFIHQFIGEMPSGSQWGICAGDLDNNGIPDILAGGRYDGIKIAMANNDGSAFTIKSIDQPATFVQTVNFADINMDGWLDAFICHDDSTSRVFLNDSTGQLIYSPDAINLDTRPATDNSGNYGSVWSDIDNDGDLDLYIAKCRQGVGSPSDGRRINQLFLNNGDGTYTQDTLNVSGLRIGAQSWTADFGDIDNDGDFDCFVTNHDVSSQLLENDGNGHFTDITAAAGMFNAIGGLPIQGLFRDFDNDGYVDILVAGTQHYLFRNQGDKTFESVAILDAAQMESCALGDLNHDGFQDIYAGHAEIYTDPSTIPDALWFNNGNDNHYIGLNLRGVESNRSAIGTKVYLYSSLGIQVREVRSGESYGIMNATQIHFGTDSLTTVDSLVIEWPSGLRELLLAPAVDQYLTVEEGRCVIPEVNLDIFGSTVFCSGDSVQLRVPDGFAAYTWNSGSADSLLTIKTTGQYAVTVTTNAGCTAVSDIVSITVDPDETPVITSLSDTSFCIGGAVLLAASPAAGYLWSTGDTTQMIEVSETGNYSVVTQGLCETFSSAPIQVTALDAPLPVPVGDTVALFSSASLSAGGDELVWYDAATGGNVLFTGDPFITPPLDSTTMFWVANNAQYGPPDQFAGMVNHMGSNFAGPQTNGQIIFDCYTPFKIISVKVSANLPGFRMIELRSAGGAVLASKLIDVVAGTSVVEVNLDVPVGNDLILTTNVGVNQQNLGTNGPQLRRSDLGVNYPYEISGYLKIKSSNYGVSRYYYFYNWEVELSGVECLSDRVPVLAVVDSSLVSVKTILTDADVQLYPNPNQGTLQLRWNDYPGGPLLVYWYNAQGQRVHHLQGRYSAGNLALSLQDPGLKPGVYTVSLRTSKGIVTRRLIRY